MTLLLALPEGDGPAEVTLRHRGAEVAASGPQGLAAAADGTILVADTLAGRILRVRPDGAALPPLAMAWVEDLLVDDGGRVYGWSRVERQVATFSARGQRTAVRNMPETDRWTAGLAPSGSGGAALRTAFQESVALDDEDLRAGLGEGIPGRDGQRYRALRRGREGRVEVVERGVDDGGQERWGVASTFPVPLAGEQGSLGVVGVTPASIVVLDVQEVLPGAPLAVDRRVRRYGPEGELVSEAVVPRGTYAPAHALALAPDGRVLALRPTEAGIEVWALPEEGGPR